MQQNKLKPEFLFLHKFKSRNRGLKVVQQNKLKCETLFLAIFRILILESGLKEGKEAQQKSWKVKNYLDSNIYVGCRLVSGVEGVLKITK